MLVRRNLESTWRYTFHASLGYFKKCLTEKRRPILKEHFIILWARAYEEKNQIGQMRREMRVNIHLTLPPPVDTTRSGLSQSFHHPTLPGWIRPFTCEPFPELHLTGYKRLPIMYVKVRILIHKLQRWRFSYGKLNYGVLKLSKGLQIFTKGGEKEFIIISFLKSVFKKQNKQTKTKGSAVTKEK